LYDDARTCQRKMTAMIHSGTNFQVTKLNDIFLSLSGQSNVKECHCTCREMITVPPQS
jgi:hypothetical protein